MNATLDPHFLLGDYATSLWLPTYPSGSRGDWRVEALPLTSGRGYWGKNYRLNGTVALFGPWRETGAAWMSLVPMEIESQEIGIAAARGHTVVLGLGMGWCAANVALNPAVERVTVIERDPQVVALIEALGVFAQLPAEAAAKISVVEADALEWRPDAPVDTIQADIWAAFVDPQRWDDVRRMQANIRADAVYFWGQEMELWRLACRAEGRVPGTLTSEALIELVTATGLPLILDRGADYAARIATTAHWWTPKEIGWWDAT